MYVVLCMAGIAIAATVSKFGIQGVARFAHLSEGTVLKNKSSPDSAGLVAAGLISGSLLVLDTPAAATVAAEHTSPTTATTGQDSNMVLWVRGLNVLQRERSTCCVHGMQTLVLLDDAGLAGASSEFCRTMNCAPACCPTFWTTYLLSLVRSESWPCAPGCRRTWC